MLHGTRDLLPNLLLQLTHLCRVTQSFDHLDAREGAVAILIDQVEGGVNKGGAHTCIAALLGSRGGLDLRHQLSCAGLGQLGQVERARDKLQLADRESPRRR